jgi:hypothetical protein
MPNTVFQPLTANIVNEEPCLGPLLLTAQKAAALCSVSLRNWQSWNSAGKIPRATRIGRLNLWRLEELRDWVSAGCPRRAAWENMRKNR